MRDPVIILPTMTSKGEDDPWGSRETERIPKISQHTSSISMPSVVHSVVNSVRQVRRNEHLVDWAGWVLCELRAHVTLVHLRRPDAEGHLIDLFATLTRLYCPIKFGEGPDDGPVEEALVHLEPRRGLVGVESKASKPIRGIDGAIDRVGRERVVPEIRTGHPPIAIVIIRAASIMHVVCRQFAPNTFFFNFPDSLRARRARPLPEFIYLFFIDESTGRLLHRPSADSIAVCAFGLVDVRIGLVVEPAFIDCMPRVERVAFKAGHSGAVRVFFFGAVDGDSILATVFELVALVSVVTAPLKVCRLHCLCQLANMGVQSLGPFWSVLRKIMSTEAGSIRVLMELSVELGIALDGLYNVCISVTIDTAGIN